ncbi:unnamed protein product [Brassica oleracea]|uniref:Uncharacterized protein n=1 Tax=Brassica oleracea var. oleracea TaxID=109376 RepID=A0A0D3BRG5_BRAOL
MMRSNRCDLCFLDACPLRPRSLIISDNSKTLDAVSSLRFEEQRTSFIASYMDSIKYELGSTKNLPLQCHVRALHA